MKKALRIFMLVLVILAAFPIRKAWASLPAVEVTAVLTQDGASARLLLELESPGPEPLSAFTLEITCSRPVSLKRIRSEMDSGLGTLKVPVGTERLRWCSAIIREGSSRYLPGNMLLQRWILMLQAQHVQMILPYQLRDLPIAWRKKYRLFAFRYGNSRNNRRKARRPIPLHPAYGKRRKPTCCLPQWQKAERKGLAPPTGRSLVSRAPLTRKRTGAGGTRGRSGISASFDGAGNVKRSGAGNRRKQYAGWKRLTGG